MTSRPHQAVVRDKISQGSRKEIILKTCIPHHSQLSHMLWELIHIACLDNSYEHQLRMRKNIPFWGLCIDFIIEKSGTIIL